MADSVAVAAVAGNAAPAPDSGVWHRDGADGASYGRTSVVRWSLVLVVALLAAACTSAGTIEAEPEAELPGVQEEAAPLTPFALLPADGEEPTEPTAESVPTAEAEVAAEPTPPPPTPVPRDPTVAWPAAESTRDMVNFLEALRAGAYEQAAWPANANGILFDGQTPEITGADFLANACAGGLCSGPYLVRGQPGFIDDETMRAVAIVVVTHLGSGQQSRMAIVTFEGQRVIGNLPPLVADTNEATFRESLFGDTPPQYLVVERFEAFEVWDGDTSEWFTNWHAEKTSQIEGEFMVSPAGVFSVTDPQQFFELGCSQLIERAGEVIALDGCVTDSWALQTVATGEVADAVVEFLTKDYE